MQKIGCEKAEDFEAKFAAFIQESATAKTFMAENKTTIESLEQRIKALEDGKFVSESRVTEIVSGETTKAVSAWADSEAGKKKIGAEASRITMEAIANVGTMPAKPAPAAAGAETPEAKARALEAEGKFEEAYKLDKNLQAEFPSAKSYAAYAKAAGMGQVKIATSTRN